MSILSFFPVAVDTVPRSNTTRRRQTSSMKEKKYNECGSVQKLSSLRRQLSFTVLQRRQIYSQEGITRLPCGKSLFHAPMVSTSARGMVGSFTEKLELVAQREPSWPKMAPLATLPVPTRLLSTYACQDIV